MRSDPTDSLGGGRPSIDSRRIRLSSAEPQRTNWVVHSCNGFNFG